MTVLPEIVRVLAAVKFTNTFVPTDNASVGEVLDTPEAEAPVVRNEII